MRYRSAGAFRTALERRLQTLAEQGEIPLLRLRKLVVFDRLMARLLVVASDRWVLKGAVALHFRVGPHFRTTKDLDIGRHDDEQASTADFRLAQSVDLGDYFTFAVQRTGKLDELLDGVAVRYHITAEVDGRRFEDVTVDVGFTDPLTVVPEILRGPDLLSFADIPPVAVPTLPLDQHVAEKVHAYTRAYASHQPSTRVKDLIDLALISSLFPFQAGRLRRSLRSTFEKRGTHSLPVVMPPTPPGWSLPYRKLAIEVGLPPEVAAGYQAAAAFLNPVLDEALAEHMRWEPGQQGWSAVPEG